jgi:hypothetical protein
LTNAVGQQFVFGNEVRNATSFPIIFEKTLSAPELTTRLFVRSC